MLRGSDALQFSRGDVVFRGGRGVDISRCNIVFKGGGGGDVLQCPRRNALFRGGKRILCLVLLNMQYGVQMKGVIDVLRCSRCKVSFNGSGGIAIL